MVEGVASAPSGGSHGPENRQEALLVSLRENVGRYNPQSDTDCASRTRMPSFNTTGCAQVPLSATV